MRTRGVHHRDTEAPRLNGRPLDEDMQKVVMGFKFERLAQQKKVKVLKALDSLDENFVKAFDELRKIRNKFVHATSDPQEDLDKDASTAVRHASTLLAKTLHVSIENGRVRIPPVVMQFFKDTFNSESDDLIADKKP